MSDGGTLWGCVPDAAQWRPSELKFFPEHHTMCCYKHGTLSAYLGVGTGVLEVREVWSAYHGSTVVGMGWLATPDEPELLNADEVRRALATVHEHALLGPETRAICDAARAWLEEHAA